MVTVTEYIISEETEVALLRENAGDRGLEAKTGQSQADIVGVDQEKDAVSLVNTEVSRENGETVTGSRYGHVAETGTEDGNIFIIYL